MGKYLIDIADLNELDYSVTQDQLDWLYRTTGKTLEDIRSSTQQYQDDLIENVLMRIMVDGDSTAQLYADRLISAITAA